MTKKGLEPKLIPYEHTLYDILIKNMKGKYFQNMMAPHLLFQIPEESELNIHYVDMENERLSVWFPLLKEHRNVSLKDFHEYALISEEQFKEYEKNPSDVFDYLLVHKDSKAFKESEKNKANLSAQENSKIIDVEEPSPEKAKAILEKLLSIIPTNYQLILNSQK